MSDEAERLRERIELQFECRAAFRRIVTVPACNELYSEQLLVHIFDLKDHPIAGRAYAWEDGGWITAVQHGWFVRSPADAVRQAHTTPPAWRRLHPRQSVPTTPTLACPRSHRPSQRPVRVTHRFGDTSSDPSQTEPAMTKFFCLIAAIATFAPVAFATLTQAAQIV